MSSSLTLPPPPRKVVVIGATGRQGGATARRLLAIGGWEVHALTRDPASDAAKDLVKLGMTVVKGDCLEVDSLDAAFKGAYGVFAVTNPFSKRWTGGSGAVTDTDAETVQGINVADACKRANVRHLVFASVAGAEAGVHKVHVATFEAKWRVEEHIRQIGIPASILCPTGFFENMRSPFAGIKQGVMPGLLKPGTRTQMISTIDIGIFAAIAFENPAEWIGKRLEIAGDTMTPEQQVATIARLRGEEGKWTISVPPGWVFKLFVPKAVGTLKEFLEKEGTKVDVDECRRLHPGLMTFEQWLKHEGLDKEVLDKPGMCAVM
jgi:uncharacterized protein YbjT (DUF2867 family)